MQLNVYVPKDKVSLIEAIERLAREQHRSKNDVVLRALEQYLDEYRDPPTFGRYDLGVTGPLRRRDLYEGRLDRKLNAPDEP